MPFKKGETPKGSKPFKKGESGNPNGRPRKIPEIDDLIAEVLGFDPSDPEKQSEAKNVLLAQLKSAKGGNVQAQIAILDRAYGKPKQQIDANVNIGKQVYKISDDLTIEL